MAIDINNGKIYVSQASSDKVRVVDVSKVPDISKISNYTIPTDRNPRGIAINPDNHMVYVANMLSGTVSIINGSTDNAKATYVLSFKTNPLTAGDISCKER